MDVEDAVSFELAAVADALGRPLKRAIAAAAVVVGDDAVVVEAAGPGAAVGTVPKSVISQLERTRLPSPFPVALRNRSPIAGACRAAGTNGASL